MQQVSGRIQIQVMVVRVTPTRTFATDTGTPCREFTQTVSIGGQMEEAYGTAVSPSRWFMED